MTVEELLLSFDVIPQKIICIGAKEKPFESEYAEIVCDYGEYEVADFRYTPLSKTKTIHIWVKPTINKRLKKLKSEREIIQNMKCLSFNLRYKCLAWYDKEIECIERDGG